MNKNQGIGRTSKLFHPCEIVTLFRAFSFNRLLSILAHSFKTFEQHNIYISKSNISHSKTLISLFQFDFIEGTRKTFTFPLEFKVWCNKTEPWNVSSYSRNFRNITSYPENWFVSRSLVLADSQGKIKHFDLVVASVYITGGRTVTYLLVSSPILPSSLSISWRLDATEGCHVAKNSWQLRWQMKF